MSFKSLVVVAAMIASRSVVATPAVVYQFDGHARVIGVNGLVNIEEPYTEAGSGCEHRIAEVTVDDVVYQGASDMVAGFRARKEGTREWYGLFRMNSKAIYNAVPNAARMDVQRLVQKGARLVVVYQVCGSGGFIGVRDIFKKSAVNNP